MLSVYTTYPNTAVANGCFEILYINVAENIKRSYSKRTELHGTKVAR